MIVQPGNDKGFPLSSNLFSAPFKLYPWSLPDKNFSSLTLQEKPKLKKPPLYKVIMLNDDYTPMEFVVEMLQTYFSKSQEQATEIMLHIHQKGLGVCGLYTFEIAESKAAQVLDKARKNQHPLQIKLEKEWCYLKI